MNKALTTLLVLLCSEIAFAQNPTYQLVLCHDACVSASVYEFDVYIARTGTTPFELASLQPIMVFDPGISTGNLTLSMNAGSSALNAGQQPLNMSINGNELRINPRVPPGAGSGTMIPAAPGVRVGRFRLTSTVPMSGQSPLVRWKNSSGNPVTKADAYVNLVNLNVTDTTGHLDSLLNTSPLPVALFSPVNASIYQPFTLTLNWNPSAGAASYRVQVSTDSLFSTTVVNDSVSGTSREVGPLVSNAYYWRVNATNAIGSGDWSPAWRFTTLLLETVQYPVADLWNLISLPLAVDDGRKSVLFPTSISGAFRFRDTAGYVNADTLVNGEGYWLKFPSAQNVGITGLGRLLDTLVVTAGWNMIGSLSFPLATDAILEIPSGIVETEYYGYSAGFISADSLQPARGYWVKTNQAGKLVLNSNAFSMPPSSRKGPSLPALALEDGINSVQVRDAHGKTSTLYFSSTRTDVNPQRYELPPDPPIGIFDVRFESRRAFEVADVRNSEDKRFPLHIAGATYPLTLSWNVVENGSAFSLEIGGAVVHALEGSGSVSIQDAGGTGIALRIAAHPGAGLPAEFRLHQNYPNPFNPGTTLEYDLPAPAQVSLKIFDVVGAEVATLVNETQEAGYKVTTWNSTNSQGLPVASGIYFYRISVTRTDMPGNPIVELKKMVLLK